MLALHSSSKVQWLAHINPLKILARIDYAIRNKNIAIVYFILSSCDVAALKAGRRRVALACKVFLSKLERCTGCGPQH